MYNKPDKFIVHFLFKKTIAGFKTFTYLCGLK